MEPFWIEISSPIGAVQVFADEKTITGIYFGRDRARTEGRPRVNDVLRRAESQLSEYFAGRRQTFDLPLSPRGTDFQKSVWKVMQKIPFGQTRTYGEIARAVRRPAATRAVGAACGRNPLPIVIPCHRVVGSDGGLTGFGGGLPAKQWLLAHEGVRLCSE